MISISKSNEIIKVGKIGKIINITYLKTSRHSTQKTLFTIVWGKNSMQLLLLINDTHSASKNHFSELCLRILSYDHSLDALTVLSKGDEGS